LGKKTLRTCIIAFCITIATVVVSPAALASDLKMNVNQSDMKFTFGTPFIENGRSMFPLRDLLIGLGIPNDKDHIIWNGGEQSVTAIHGDTTVKLTVGDKSIFKNGTIYSTLDVPAKNVANRVYLPARAVAEAFGFKVDYDTDSQTVQIYDHKLVTLGDSITFGYNLSLDHTLPSPLAFPYLVGNTTHYGVKNFSQPGWTSDDLLKALSTLNSEQMIANADVITLDIGSNDIFRLAIKNNMFSPLFTGLTQEQQAEFEVAIQHFGETFPSILATLKVKAPNAKIKVINLYNPAPSSMGSLHAFGEKYISEENSIIAKAASDIGVPVIDVYSIFKDHESELIIPLDVHPSVKGQEAIAKAVAEAISKN
jgi:lysophospholipase L1-like esterase